MAQVILPYCAICIDISSIAGTSCFTVVHLAIGWQTQELYLDEWDPIIVISHSKQ